MHKPLFKSREYMLPGGKKLMLGKKTLVMGILNVTPDSFSDGGQFDKYEAAVSRALEMQEQGADIIDVGGESTRPGSAAVSEEDELTRVIPIISSISKNLAIPISIDSYKAKVAYEALKSGATLINDVWGFQKDKDMAKVASQFQVPSILMHNQETAVYEDDIIESMKFFFDKSINLALKAGLDEKLIILDPGIGFGKNLEQNLEVMSRLDELALLGYPLLLGASRKSMIGHVLDAKSHERLEGTLAVKTAGIMLGCDIIRVHDIKENVQVAKMTDAIFRR